MARFDGVRRRSLAGGLTAVLLATVVLAIIGAGRAAAEAPPVPDSACLNEASFRSTSGDVKASLLIINNTGETLQSLWLDYDGQRVFYSQIAPFTSYVQPTWLTHPWIIANLQGACYRFLVMNSVQQTVTVNPGDGPPSSLAAPPTTTAARPTSTARPPVSVAPAPAASAPRTTVTNAAPSAVVDTGGGSGFPTVPVVAGLAALAGLVAALAFTGHLPGLGGSAAVSVAPGSATGTSQVTFDPATQQYVTNVGGNQVAVGTQAELQDVLAAAGNPPEGSPLYQQTVDSFLQAGAQTATSGTISVGSSASQVTFDPATQQYVTSVGGDQVVVATHAEVQGVLNGVGNPPPGSPLYQQTVDNFLNSRSSSAPPSAGSGSMPPDGPPADLAPPP